MTSPHTWLYTSQLVSGGMERLDLTSVVDVADG